MRLAPACRAMFLMLAPLTAWAQDGPPALPPVVHMDEKAAVNEGLAITVAKPGHLVASLPVMTRVMPDAVRVVHIHPAGTGKVVQVLVQPGQVVRRGDGLLRYQDHSLHVARLQAIQLRAALSAAIAARDDAASACARGRLLAGQTVSVAELRRRQDALAQAQATVRARQADVDTLGHRFAEEFNSSSEHDGTDEISTLIAPFDGTVMTLDTSLAGDLTPAMDVASIADLSRVWLVSDLPPEQAVRVQPGGTQVTQTAQGSVTSQIETVDGVASPLTGLVRVISAVPDPARRLMPGTVLDATLQTHEDAGGIVVPAAAVQEINGQSVVFRRLDSATYAPVVVMVVLEEGGQAVVQGGLQGGEPIVGQGSFALRSIIGLAGMDAD
ncbi:efflux RND transporter periplasmic adaptor subunit [Komagataeibacter xylinus]